MLKLKNVHLVSLRQGQYYTSMVSTTMCIALICLFQMYLNSPNNHANV